MHRPEHMVSGVVVDDGVVEELRLVVCVVEVDVKDEVIVLVVLNEDVSVVVEL